LQANSDMALRQHRYVSLLAAAVQLVTLLLGDYRVAYNFSPSSVSGRLGPVVPSSRVPGDQQWG